MAVNLPPVSELRAVPGIRIGTAAAGIKYRARDDLAIFALDPGSTVGGIFTQSSFRAAPVAVASERLGAARGLVVNSGNANAATGARWTGGRAFELRPRGGCPGMRRERGIAFFHRRDR